MPRGPRGPADAAARSCARSSTASATCWAACPPTSTRTSTSTATAAAGPSSRSWPTSTACPLRDRPPVVFKGGFYGQWEYGVSDRAKVSLEALERDPASRADGGIYEMSCHPGYVDPELECVYHEDRELRARDALRPAPARASSRSRASPSSATASCRSPRPRSSRRWRSMAAEGRPRFSPSADRPRPVAGGRPGGSEGGALGPAGRHAGRLRDYLVDLPVSVHADVLFAAAFALVARLLLGATRSQPRAHRAAGNRLPPSSERFACLYAVASIQIFAFLRSPLTYPLLYLAGDMSNMRSSIGSFVTPGDRRGPRARSAALPGGGSGHVGSAPGTPSRAPSRSRGLGARRRALLSLGARAVDGRWGGRDDHLIARNPHFEFLSSVAVDGFGTSGPASGRRLPRRLSRRLPARRRRSVPAFDAARRPKQRPARGARVDGGAST